MSKPRLLDLFCCEGGAGMGYSRAGFEVVGVDIRPQPRYPFEFIQADVLGLRPDFLATFDAIHASPPCQAYTKAQRLQKNYHADLIAPVRQMLEDAGRPYVIENVPGAPLRLYSIMLCGTMFPGLRVYRHRLFETSFAAHQPHHPPHTAQQVKMGRPVTNGEFIQPVGNFSGVGIAREAMDCPWMSRNGLRECVPPAFTEYVGARLLAHIKSKREAA